MRSLIKEILKEFSESGRVDRDNCPNTIGRYNVKNMSKDDYDHASIVRFFSKVKKTKTCWIWTDTKCRKGYGRFIYLKKFYQAHRWLHIMLNGPIDKNSDCCHKCDVKSCVNPSHIFIGSRKDNMQDCLSKGRFSSQIKPFCFSRGEDHPRSKMNWDRVLYVRENMNVPSLRLAKKFGVSVQTIIRIKNNETWLYKDKASRIRAEEIVE